MELLGSRVGNHWSGWKVQCADEGQDHHGQEGAWLPSGAGPTVGWGEAGADKVDKFSPHREAELQGCYSASSSFLGRVPLLASAAAAVVAAAVAEVECAVYAEAAAELAWLDAD